MTRPMTMRGPLYELALAYGGIQALADECGVNPTTLRRWASGEIAPRRLEVFGLNALLKTHRIKTRMPLPTGRNGR